MNCRPTGALTPRQIVRLCKLPRRARQQIYTSTHPQARPLLRRRIHLGIAIRDCSRYHGIENIQALRRGWDLCCTRIALPRCVLNPIIRHPKANLTGFIEVGRGGIEGTRREIPLPGRGGWIGHNLADVRDGVGTAAVIIEDETC